MRQGMIVEEEISIEHHCHPKKSRIDVSPWCGSDAGSLPSVLLMYGDTDQSDNTFFKECSLIEVTAWIRILPR